MPITLANALGDGMVLQRAPRRATLWGFGTPSVLVRVRFESS